MQKLFTTTRDYLLSALFVMATAALAFGVVSFAAHLTAGSVQVAVIVVLIVILLSTIWSVSSTPLMKAMWQLLNGGTWTPQIGLSEALRSLPALSWDHSPTRLSTKSAMLSVAGKSQFLCVALSEDWYAEHKFRYGLSKTLRSRNHPAKDNLLLGAIRKNSSNIDYLIRSIRNHEVALRSKGIHRIHVRHFDSYFEQPWFHEHYSDFASQDGKILVVILECSSEWNKVQEDWARQLVGRSCGASFADIVGIKGGIREMKTLPSPPPLIDTDQSIGVF